MVINMIAFILLLPLVCWSQQDTDYLLQIEKRYSKEDKRLHRELREGKSLDTESYPKGLKDLYFLIYQEEVSHFLEEEKIDSADLRDIQEHQKILESLEHEEGQVGRLEEKTKIHEEELKKSKYQASTFVFVDYISWQQNVTLSTPAGDRTLIVTNQGECAGGGYGYENSRFHSFIDGCLLYGRGDISAQGTAITYNQRNVYGVGGKVSLAGGMFVSQVKAEVGFKLPVTYFKQNFSNPNQTSFSGYTIKDPATFNSWISLYTRWPFGNFFFNTEIGKKLGKDLTMWSLGVGYKF